MSTRGNDAHKRGPCAHARLEHGWRPPLLSRLLWEKYSRITLGSNQVGRSMVPRLQFCSQQPCLGWTVTLEVAGVMNWIGQIFKKGRDPNLRILCVNVHSVVSHSLQLHGLEPARLLCPWDSPGKNTGMGSHFLLQGIFPTQGLTLVSYVSCTDRWVFFITGAKSRTPTKAVQTGSISSVKAGTPCALGHSC